MEIHTHKEVTHTIELTQGELHAIMAVLASWKLEVGDRLPEPLQGSLNETAIDLLRQFDYALQVGSR